MSNIYADALAVQNACNLSGVVHSWAEILSAQVRAGMDTEAIWHDSVNVLFASKVASLTGCEDFNVYSKAYAECQEKAA